MALRSAQFDDIYFSPDDGLAETNHVFLQGNNLPAAWEGLQNFTITETGFGTGLNFLSAWKLFEETARPGQVLDYISFEKYPLAPAAIRDALSGWSDFFGGRLERLAEKYPLRVSGFHRIHLSDRVCLTLIFDDVNAALPQLVVPRGVNAWFLDGFAPAKNPDMWSEMLYREMARLSATGATVASFTAAGHVRRGLAAQGFDVVKARGYGRKRDMTRALWRGDKEIPPMPIPQRVAVLGGGLAGTACAYALRRRGLEAVIFDPRGLARFASGNPLGLYNPRFSQHRSAESDMYSSGFAAIAGLKDMSRRCGSLHLITDDDKRKRFDGVAQNWGWHGDHLRHVAAAEASGIAGVALAHDALFLPDSGYAYPDRLCAYYAAGIPVETGAPDPVGLDAVILANGIQAKDHPALAGLPIHTVRGQISFIEPSSAAAPVLRANICYSGYISADNERGTVAGATFQQWRTDTDVTDDDHAEIAARLEEHIPALSAAFRVTGGRAALRCAARDRFPVIGPVADHPGLYVSTAHGSHGLVSTLAGAEYLADRLCQTPWSLSRASADALDPARFAKREQKKGLLRG